VKITDFTLFPRASRLIVVCRRVLTVARVGRRHRRKPMNVTGKRSLRCSDNRSVSRKLNPTPGCKFKHNPLFSKQWSNLFEIKESQGELTKQKKFLRVNLREKKYFWSKFDGNQYNYIKSSLGITVD
jgi:hypothetical protein